VNYWEQPNLFVVGDDDQSIFRFQGANVENMLHFQHDYVEEVLMIVLENNYRSTQPILDASTIIINNNQERLVNKIKGLEKS
jgi:DNA helicase-2/ATP-dependent DNA helicase PcrA